MKQPNWKLPLVLSISLFVLGAGAYWLEFKHKPKSEEAAEAAKKIFDLKDQQVRSFEIFDGKRKLTLNCTELASKTCKPGDNAKWLLSDTFVLKADNSNANALISALNNLSVPETIGLKDEAAEKRSALLKEYGLDEASRASSRRIQVSVENPKDPQKPATVTLYLGLQHPVGDSIFGLVDRDNKADESVVYLVPAYFKANLEHDLTYWRDKRLLTVASHEIGAFKLSSSKGAVSGTKSGERWLIKSGGEEVPGDTEAIEALLSGVTFLNAKGFAGKADLAGLKQGSSLLMEPTTGDKKSIQIQLYFDAKKLLATVSNLDSIFELELNSKERFEKSFRELRLAKLITSMERFTAKRLEFSGKPLGATSLVLVQKEGRWTQASSGAKSEVNVDKVQALLDRIGGNKIQEFVANKSLPKGPAPEESGIKLALWDEKDPEGKSPATRTLLFWRVGSKLYAKDLASTRSESYVVDPLIADSLPWSMDAFAPAPSSTPTPTQAAPAKK